MLALVLLAVLTSSDPAVFVKSLYDADQRNVYNADPVYGVRTRRVDQQHFR